MKKKQIIEKRTDSKIKPWFYFVVQCTLLWEIFWILTGEERIYAWSRLEQLTFGVIILYLAVRSYKISRRTAPRTTWDDRIDAERYMKS